MTCGPDKRGCRDQAQRCGFRGRFEPEPDFRLDRGSPYHIVSCKARASAEPLLESGGLLKRRSREGTGTP